MTKTRRTFRALIALSVALACIGMTLQSVEAQDAWDSGSPWQRSISVGLPVVETQTSPLLTIVGVQFTQMRPGRVGLDFSVGTMPGSLSEGSLSLGVRGGLALPLQLSRSTLMLPSAGISAFTAAAIPETIIKTSGGRGFNVGVSFIASDSVHNGIRFSTTRHQLRGVKSPIWLMELGFLLPRTR